MDNGWIKIDRGITEHWIWSDAERLKWWLDLILSANWKAGEVFADGNKISLEKGQLIASINYLSQKWKRSPHTVLRFMKLLEDERMIERHTLHRQTPIITICNYERYQCSESTNLHNLMQTLVPTTPQYQLPIIVPTNRRKKEINKETMLTHSKESKPMASDNFDFENFVKSFNDKVKGRIPEISRLTEARKTALMARAEEFGTEALDQVVDKVVKSDFLCGQGEKKFTASFDWIFRPNNFPKILEGNYDNKDRHAGGSAHGTRQFFNRPKEDYTDEI